MECLNGRKSEVSPVPDQFPDGLRVLVVDDDDTCLRIVEKMLKRCKYQVTCCSQAKIALKWLRERKGSFDLVLSDVHMPDMDGFKLLELVGLEMDLPVIMMSADARTNLVLQGIQHGACDYLIKPIRDEELKNIWQHVVRKRCNERKKHDPSGNTEDHERLKKTTDDGVCDSSLSDGADEANKTRKKKRNSKDGDDADLENDDPNGSKKPRVVWSVELHQQFVTAVHQLGIEKAVPKRILELMNVPGLTRENVASHLQKFRLYLKRLSGISQQGVLPGYCAMDENLKAASLERLDIHALAASGQLPAQTLAALQSELISRSATNMMLLPTTPRTPTCTSLLASSSSSTDPNVAYGRPLIKCSSNISRQSRHQPFVSDDNVCAEFSDCSAKNLLDVAAAGSLVAVNQNSNALISYMPAPQPNVKNSVVMESSHSVNVQPSCLVVPSQTSHYFQEGNAPDSLGQNCHSIDQNSASFHLSRSSFAQPPEEAPCGSLPSGYFNPISFPSASSCSRNIQKDSVDNAMMSPWQIDDPKTYNMNCEYNAYNHVVPGSSVNPLNLDKSIASSFSVGEPELTQSNMNMRNDVYTYKVKQEPSVGLTDNVRVGVPVRVKLPSTMPMHIFSDYGSL